MEGMRKSTFDDLWFVVAAMKKKHGTFGKGGHRRRRNEASDLLISIDACVHNVDKASNEGDTDGISQIICS